MGPLGWGGVGEEAEGMCSATWGELMEGEAWAVREVMGERARIHQLCKIQTLLPKQLGACRPLL